MDLQHDEDDVDQRHHDDNSQNNKLDNRRTLIARSLPYLLADSALHSPSHSLH